LADGAGVIAATVGQVALLCAVLRGLAGGVVLIVVRVRVAEVHDGAAAAEGIQQLRAAQAYRTGGLSSGERRGEEAAG
jgi:hypothetical protein